MSSQVRDFLQPHFLSCARNLLGTCCFSKFVWVGRRGERKLVREGEQKEQGSLTLNCAALVSIFLPAYQCTKESNPRSLTWTKAAPQEALSTPRPAFTAKFEMGQCTELHHKLSLWEAKCLQFQLTKGATSSFCLTRLLSDRGCST